MTLTIDNYEALKVLLPIGSYTHTQAKEIVRIYAETEQKNLGQATCIDCVMKMKETLAVRFREYEYWLMLLEKKGIEPPEKAACEDISEDIMSLYELAWKQTLMYINSKEE